MNVCMYVCMCVCMHVCVYVFLVLLSLAVPKLCISAQNIYLSGAGCPGQINMLKDVSSISAYNIYLSGPGCPGQIIF